MSFLEILNDFWYLVLTFLYVGILRKNVKYFFSIGIIILSVGIATYTNGFLLTEPYPLSIHIFHSTIELYSLITFLVTFGISIGILLFIEGIKYIRLGRKIIGGIHGFVGIGLLVIAMPLVLEVIKEGASQVYQCTDYFLEIDTNYFLRFFFTQLFGSHLALYLSSPGIVYLSKKSKYPKFVQGLFRLLICIGMSFFALFIASSGFFCDAYQWIYDLVFWLIALFILCTFCISISYLITWWRNPQPDRWKLFVFGFLFSMILSIGGGFLGLLYVVALSFGGD